MPYRSQYMVLSSLPTIPSGKTEKLYRCFTKSKYPDLLKAKRTGGPLLDGKVLLEDTKKGDTDSVFESVSPC